MKKGLRQLLVDISRMLHPASWNLRLDEEGIEAVQNLRFWIANLRGLRGIEAIVAGELLYTRQAKDKGFRLDIA